MTKKLRWGFLSTAKINRALIPPLRASKRSQLAAVASRSVENAQLYAREHHIPQAYGSYQDLINDPEIDVIYNSLPNHLHAEWTIKALQAGKHVLVEKPFALTTGEVRVVGETARMHGKIVAEGFMYRHHPQTMKVIQLIAEGKLGQVQFINGHFTFTLQNPESFHWKAEYGGGSLWDIGCYPISFARMLTGHAPVNVFGWQKLTAEGVDLTFSGEMIYPDGEVAQFFSSFGLPYSTYMEIRGTEATLLIPTPFTPRDRRNSIILRTPQDREYRFTFPQTDLYLGEVEDIESAILDGSPLRISLQESEDNVATILRLYQSARQHEPGVQ